MIEFLAVAVVSVLTVIMFRPPIARAQTAAPTRAVEFRFTPRARTQIALWIEKPDGTFLKTVALTQSVGARGLGNRPGAAQMNSAYHWPYGRREGVLPLWAHRRVGAPGAVPFKRVIFQNRQYEGDASRTSEDSSPESYYCLSFSTSTATARDQLDAITCATSAQPQTDKGRYLLPTDVAAGYWEPAEISQQGVMRALDQFSLYPPRMDVKPCMGCLDRPDVADYADDARAVMPDIDAVTMATPAGEVEQSLLFSIPGDWADGDYVSWIEVNVEGDYNGTFNMTTYPTPTKPEGAWDGWAIGSGYSYRGQPSVAYRVPFTVGVVAEFSTAEPIGYGDVDGFGSSGGVLHPMDSAITDNSTDPSMKGSGADRLHVDATGQYRFKVSVRDPGQCVTPLPPQAPGDVSATPLDVVTKHSHEWGTLSFIVPTSPRPLDHYEVRYSSSEITTADPMTFARAPRAVAAQQDAPALVIPLDVAPGDTKSIKFGGMNPLTTYWIALRAVDTCNVAGPYVVAKMTTTSISFTKLSGCFVATAAYGSDMEPQVASLRRVRDALRQRSTLFSIATDVYYRSGPAAADVIARSAVARALVRQLLAPVVTLAQAAFPTGPTGLGGQTAEQTVTFSR